MGISYPALKYTPVLMDDSIEKRDEKPGDEQSTEVVIPIEHAGMRLDQSLAALFPEYSRSRMRVWIEEGRVAVDSQARKPRWSVSGGESVVVKPEYVDEVTQHQAQNIALDVVYEDEQLLAINKPAGLVVHPGAGNRDGTLLNALLHHVPSISQIPRAGIVHRLDKDTSGLLVVAKTLPAHTSLVQQLQDRAVDRRYYALVRGHFISGDTIDAPIRRHPRDRTKMTVANSVDEGKEAITHFKIVERFKGHTWVEVKLETGRTHQIRVHFAHIGSPLLGDPVYAGRNQRVAGLSDALNDSVVAFPRQALHAFSLSLIHPQTHQEISWSAEMPSDMKKMIEQLSPESHG